MSTIIITNEQVPALRSDEPFSTSMRRTLVKRKLFFNAFSAENKEVGFFYESQDLGTRTDVKDDSF